MNNEQIKEVMRLADEIADYAWKEGISDGAYSMEGGIVSKDIETMKPVIAGAVGNPARTCAGSCEGNAYQIEIRRLTAERDAMAAELAALAKRKPAAVIATAGSTGGCVEWTGSIRLAVGSKLYIRPIPAEPVNAELLEALKDARHCIGIDRDTLVDCHTNPCTGYLDPDGALAKAEYDDVIDAADAAIARAESAMPFWPDHSSAISDPLFHQARGIMGTENFGQEEGLRLAILHVLNARLPTPSATKSAPPTTTQSTCPSAGR